jgi:hypothetical protein
MIEAILLCLLHNSQNTPLPAPAPATPAPAAGPDFFTLTPAAKSVLQPNHPAIFDGNRTQGQMFLHSILTYLRLILEAFMMDGVIMEEKLVRFTMSFMVKDSAG